MKASTGLRTQLEFVGLGTAGRFGFRKDHHESEVALADDSTCDVEESDADKARGRGPPRTATINALVNIENHRAVMNSLLHGWRYPLVDINGRVLLVYA
jgi:hypothetical protein